MTGPFHRGIRVGLASLSDWQQGRAWPRRPNSVRAVAVPEEILDLPRHALTGLLATHHLTPFRPQQEVDEYHGPMGEPLDALPGARDWNLEVITSEHAAHVDAHRRPSRITARRLARSPR